MFETQVYGVVLPIELAKKARVVAAMEGKSRSRLMRELLENYLAKCKPLAVNQPIEPPENNNAKTDQ